MEVEKLLRDLREYPGLRRKACVGDWARPFLAGQADGPLALACGPGDDAGAVALAEGFLLMAAESIWAPMLDDAFFAGFCAVTVNVNDIYAMGGRPLGLVSIIQSGGFSEKQRGSFLDGMRAGLEHYRIPMLGGHTSPDKGPPFAAASVVGFAKKLLRGDGARPGHRLIAMIDMEGRRHPGFFAWDTVTGVDGKITLDKLEALVLLADTGLCSACRDISNPGLMGTLAMLLEASGAGAHVNLDLVPALSGVDISWWLKAYPSFGFLLTAPEDNVRPVTRMLEATLASTSVEWEVIGEVIEGSQITASWKGENSLFLDWREHPVTRIYSY